VKCPHCDKPIQIPKLPSRRLGFYSKVLIGLSIGESRFLPPCDPSVFTRAKLSARRWLREPSAQWIIRVQPNGTMMVQRVPNGSPTKKEVTQNPKVMEVAAIPLGHSILSTTMSSPSKFQLWIKAGARTLLNNPTAKWKSRLTTKGLRIERTA
jgi:hypothetical protein